MGDIADHHVEMFSSGKWGIPTGRGSSRWKECNNCGRRKLYWQKVEGRWLLFDQETDLQHRCPAGTVTNAWKNRK